MSNAEEKLKSIASQTPKSTWVKDFENRKANKNWLDKSFEIALKILDALDRPEWNQSRLAEALGVSKQQVSKLVKGQTNFTLETLSRIESVLGIELITILQEDEVVVKKSVHDQYKSLVQRYTTQLKSSGDKYTSSARLSPLSKAA